MITVTHQSIRGKTLRQTAPPTACLVKVKNHIERLTKIDLSWPTGRIGIQFTQNRFHDFPFFVGQIAGVSLRRNFFGLCHWSPQNRIFKIEIIIEFYQNYTLKINMLFFVQPLSWVDSFRSITAIMASSARRGSPHGSWSAIRKQVCGSCICSMASVAKSGWLSVISVPLRQYGKIGIIR